MVDRSPILALLLLSHSVAVSETSVPPSYRGKMRIPISLRTAEGTNLEKGPYLLEVKQEEGRHVLVFFVGEEVRTQVSETTPEVSTIWAAEILVVGAHYMRSSADPIGTAQERQFSKTGLPRYQEEKREWKATLRVYRSPGAPANPLTQELFAGPHPRPCGGTGQPRPVMAISIPSTDDVGLFFRAGTKNPIVG